MALPSVVQHPGDYADIDLAPKHSPWPQDHPSSGQWWKSETKNSYLSGLHLFEGSAWSTMSLKITLVCGVHTAAPGADKARVMCALNSLCG